MSGLPERIAAVRQKLWLSQPAFSARVGVTRNVVARWEGGKHGLRAGRLDRIAKLGGVSGDWLLRGDSRPPEGPRTGTTPCACCGLPGGSPAGESWCGGRLRALGR